MTAGATTERAGAAATAYIGLGGNIGDPAVAMAAALRALNAVDNIRAAAVSSLYRTPPWGKTDQPDFLNAVAMVQTTLSPQGLLDACLAAERQLKRVRAERWGPRVIDLDILWFDGRIIREPGLDIPHPRMLHRAFVLVPLAEVAPDLPLAGGTASQLARLADQQGIERLAGGQDWWKAR